MIATRDAFGQTLLELGVTHPNVVVLDADLSASTKSGLFAKKYPQRFFQMGIAEANMIGTAAGLAFQGFVPFACSFGCFLTGRYETIRVSVGYSKANVKLVGTHSGLGVGEDGATQMALEDIGLMRAVPGMVVVQPGDGVAAQWATRWAAENGEPTYLRLTRQKLPVIYGPGESFDPGAPKILRKGGGELALLGSGSTVHEILEASKELVQLDPWVIDFPILKPFPTQLIREVAQNCKLLVSVEDHNVIGGLGSVVAEAISECSHRSKLIRLGVQDLFGESGSAADLYDKYGFSAARITQRVRALF